MKKLLIFVALCATPAHACPSCMSMPLCFAEEMETARAVVLATPISGTTSQFRIDRVFKGNVKPGKVVTAASYKGTGPVILSTASAEGSPFWTGRAKPADGDVDAFVEGVLKLPSRFIPAGRAQRLAYFLPYLANRNRLLADSAYSDFSQAPYASVARYSSIVGRDKIHAWLSDRSTPPEHSSLYYVMLSSVGSAKDLPMVEEQINRSLSAKPPGFLSALIVCYLDLKGVNGLDFVEKHFLHADRDRKGAALAALKVHVDEKSPLPRSKTLQVFHSQLGDLNYTCDIIQDLAVWKDWSVLPQIEAFLKLPQKHQIIRIYAVRYLLTCPLPQAKSALASLRKTDPQLAGISPYPFVKTTQ